MRLLLAIVVGVGLPVSTVAQDLPTTQIEDHAQVIRQDSLTRAVLRQKPSRSSTIRAEARATCTNKRLASARLGPHDMRVRRLYRLCARAGY